FIRNFDFHFGNIGCIFRNSTGSIVRDPSTIQRLSNYIQLLEKCIQDKNLEGYQTVLQYFNDAKKNLSIEECFVLIDCGWAGAHWEQHIVNTLHGDNGFESNNILLHFPFLEPTNHFNDLSKYIKYTEEFAENLLFVCKQFHSSNILQLKPFLHQLLNELEKYYGKTGLKKYMQFIGAPIQADLEIKENIIHYLTTRAFPTEILSAKQLAFKIKLSVCFPEKGEWKKTSEGYQWEGQKKFDFDSEKFAKLIDLYAHYQPNFLKKVTPDFFIGEGQKEFQLKLFELFKNKLKKQLKIDSYTQWSKMTHQKIETQTLSKSEWIFRLRF
ncbi:MAG TPA: hypothetical protein VHM20_03360, partial [Gammaproteobacteria bacterium]|nr:hypothetical protein [Gammaproteobacteria bacterium]